MLGRLREVVEEAHRHGLFLFTWGDVNNDMEAYMAQVRAALRTLRTLGPGLGRRVAWGLGWVLGRP